MVKSLSRLRSQAKNLHEILPVMPTNLGKFLSSSGFQIILRFLGLPRNYIFYPGKAIRKPICKTPDWYFQEALLAS